MTARPEIANLDPNSPGPASQRSNVVSTLCLFLLLGGASALAATQLAKNSVGTKQIKKSAVATAKIKNAAVTTSKLADNAVTSGKIADGEVRAKDLGTIVTAQNTVQIAAGAEGTVDVACPEGSVMLSGGGYWTTGSNNLRTTLKQGNGWRVEGKNTLGISEPLTVQAYCLTG